MYNQITALKIEGIKLISWTDKQTKALKAGAVLHCSYKDDGIDGTAVATMFVNEQQRLSDSLTVGVRIQALDRGKFGWVYVNKLEK